MTDMWVIEQIAGQEIWGGGRKIGRLSVMGILVGVLGTSHYIYINVLSGQK